MPLSVPTRPTSRAAGFLSLPAFGTFFATGRGSLMTSCIRRDAVTRMLRASGPLKVPEEAPLVALV